MKSNKATIPVRDYEELIRDSEKVRILTQAVMDEVDPGDYWLRVICGVQEQEPIEIKIEDREPAMAPQEVFTESEEVKPPYEPAISIEKIEDVPEEDDLPEPVNLTPPPQVQGKKKIDRGKVMALHNAGWTNKDIAEEVKCSAWSVCQIIKELKGEKSNE